MKYKLLVIISLVPLLMACEPSQDASDHLDQLKSTLDRFNQAFAKADLETLDRHTPENYRHTNGNSAAFGKESWFNYLKKRKADIDSGVLVMEKYEMSEIDIQLHGNSAVITGKVLTKGVNKGEAFERQLRVSHFWILVDGIWKRAGFHDTRID